MTPAELQAVREILACRYDLSGVASLPYSCEHSDVVVLLLPEGWEGTLAEAIDALHARVHEILGSSSNGSNRETP